MGQVGGELLGRSERHLSRAGSTPSALLAQLVKGDGAAEQEVGFCIDWFDLLEVQGTLKSLLQNRNSKASSYFIHLWRLRC